jgi:hypothetical protein
MNIDDIIISNNINQAVFNEELAIDAEADKMTVDNCITWLTQQDFSDNSLEIIISAAIVILHERNNNNEEEQ